MTVLKSENCGAWASEAKPKKPKMRLRFVTKPIFTLFSVAVLIVSAALIAGTSRAQSSQCNNSISNMEGAKISKSIKLSSVNSLIFHDGQNYRIAMNYYYATSSGKEIRSYQSLQTVQPSGIGRPFSNSEFGQTISSNLLEYGEHPDYWTSSSTGVVQTGYDATAPNGWRVSIGNKFGKFPALNKGGSIAQDVYVVSGNHLLPSQSYTLSFWAKQGGSGVKKAIIEWHGTTITGIERVRTKEVPISSST